jgi:hypothetical protein
MPIRIHLNTLTITICRMITWRIHVFGFAGSENVCTIHGSIHVHGKKLKPVQLDDGHGAIATLARCSVFAWGTWGAEVEGKEKARMR